MNKLILLIPLFLLKGLISIAQPGWHTNPPESSSGNYCYVSVLVTGNEDVLVKALPQARTCLGVSHPGFTQVSGGTIDGVIEIGGRVVKYQRVDAYNSSRGQYVLMMFSKNENKELPKKALKNPIPLTFTLSAAIPGMGQMYKKEKGRGFLFLTTVLGSAAATYYFETERASYIDKFNGAGTFGERELYIKKIEDSQNYRNIGAGVTGALYLLNIIDAVASKSKRYAFEPSDRQFKWDLAYNPRSQSCGVSLSFNF